MYVYIYIYIYILSCVFFPSLYGRLKLDTKLSLDFEILLALCARKDAEGLRKALLRGRARKQQIRKTPRPKNSCFEGNIQCYLNQLVLYS